MALPPHIVQELTMLQAGIAQLQQQLAHTRNAHTALQAEHESLLDAHTVLQAEHETLQVQYQELSEHPRAVLPTAAVLPEPLPDPAASTLVPNMSVSAQLASDLDILQLTEFADVESLKKWLDERLRLIEACIAQLNP